MVSPKRSSNNLPRRQNDASKLQGFKHLAFHPTPVPQWRIHQHGTPLRTFTTNELKADPSNLNITSYYDPLDTEDAAFLIPDDDRWHPPSWIYFFSGSRLTKRHKRFILITSLLLLPLWVTWKVYIQPQQRLLANIDFAFERQAARERTGKGRMSAHAAIMLKGTTLLGSLASRHLPTTVTTQGTRGKRLIFVGDVHGCKDELVQLLEKVDFSQELDHVILTGDIIAKGPDSAGAIDLARKLEASCVRGNWDDRVLVAWEALQGRKHGDVSEEPDILLLDKAGHEERQRLSKDRAYKAAVNLNKDQINWLRACPCILDVGRINGVGRIVVAHAGLAPGVALEKQDPYAVMNMRTVDLQTLAPLEDRTGAEWEKVWEKYQERVPEEERTTIVYGHDSKRGLNIQKWSKGLDTGCVNGGTLTALIVEGTGNMTLESVPCKSISKSLGKGKPV